MTNQTQTDKATARPWLIAQRENENQFKRLWEIRGANTEYVATLALNECFGTGRVGEQSKPNAELIVQAVNEHTALVAVAEAAKVFSYIVSNPNEKLRFQSDAQIDLSKALANLAAVRGESEGGK